jgi:hypothetical protein
MNPDVEPASICSMDMPVISILVRLGNCDICKGSIQGSSQTDISIPGNLKNFQRENIAGSEGQ